ncbi:MAG: type II secretion system protein [Patescibacteria group bacterium]
MEMINRHRQAFTLIELLVVMSIISLLSSVVLARLNEGRLRAQYAKAQSDLYDISIAMFNLEQDTDKSIGRNIVGSCKEDDNEGDPYKPSGPTYTDGGEYPVAGFVGTTDFTDFAGIAGTDGYYPNWQGPYLTTNLIDPWGRPYWFDPDYHCLPSTGSAPAKGCEYADQAGNAYRVLYSRGPVDDGTVYNDYGSDNIVRILCRNTCIYPSLSNETPLTDTCTD